MVEEVNGYHDSERNLVKTDGVNHKVMVNACNNVVTFVKEGDWYTSITSVEGENKVLTLQFDQGRFQSMSLNQKEATALLVSDYAGYSNYEYWKEQIECLMYRATTEPL